MIQISIALALILWKSELSEHLIIFPLIVIGAIIDGILKMLIRNGTARWPDGSIDYGKSAPIVRPASQLGGILMILRPILLFVLVIAVFL